MTSMITYINVYVPKLATSYMVSNYQCPLPLLREKIRGCLPGLELEAEGPSRTSMLDGGLATPICVESGVPLSTSSSSSLCTPQKCLMASTNFFPCCSTQKKKRMTKKKTNRLFIPRPGRLWRFFPIFAAFSRFFQKKRVFSLTKKSRFFF
jgi:hypothetical protein